MTRSDRRRARCAATAAALVVASLLAATAFQANGSVAQSPTNPIAAENAKRGSADWEPLEPNGTPHGIEGYASQVSVSAGGLLQLHVSTRPAARYQVQIYRLGWYGGTGGRLVTCLPSCPKSLPGRTQPSARPDPQTGLLRERWPVTTSFRIPRSWVSGYYVAKLMLATKPSDWPRMGKSAVVPFIVKELAGKASRILVVSSVNTEQAYNNWGGKSLYDFNSSNGLQATKVSFDRPYAGRIYFYESRLVGFLERQPDLDISYTTDVDVHRNPSVLLRHRLVIVNGHDEYWSRTMRDAYEKARGRGVNLGFFGGDIGDWQVRFEDGERTMVGYKSAERDPHPDPQGKTTKFRFLTPPRPQCELLGTTFSEQAPQPSGRFKINAEAIKDRWFAGTGFKAGDTFTSGAGEMDVAAPDCPSYPKTTFFADARNSFVAPTVRYVAPSGAIVLGVGSYALSTQSLEDKRIQRFARNAILEMSRARR
jgi:N,N-dimethylformamidase beta subunit-like, C-terminal